MSTKGWQQQAGRLGGLRNAARHDGRDMTASARRAFLTRFENEVDPDRVLDPLERERRAEAAKRAYFLEMAMKSVRARRSK